MSNRLKVAMIDLVLSLHRKGWSQRRIAAELEINRETVARYLKQATAAPKPANATPAPISPRQRQNQPMRPPAQVAPRSRQAQVSKHSVRPVTVAALPAAARATANLGETSSSPSATRA
jgi:transposase